MTVAYFTFRVLPFLLSLAFTLYLAQVYFTPGLRELKLKKYKGTPAYDTYARLYTKHYLIAAVLTSFFFLSGILSDLFKSGHGRSPIAFAIGLCGVTASLASFYYMRRARSSKAD